MRNVSAENDIFNSLHDYGFYRFNELFTTMEKNLTNYDMSVNAHDWKQSIVNPLIDDEMNYDPKEERRLRNEKQTQLNQDQLNCYNTIITVIDNDSKTVHFFLHDSAGTNKIFLYQIFCHHYRALNDIVLCVAFSGIAIFLLSGGQTSHSRFKIPLEVTNDTTCYITRNMRLYDLLRKTRLII